MSLGTGFCCVVLLCISRYNSGRMMMVETGIRTDAYSAV